MMSSFERSPQAYARACGLFYLAIIGLGMFGELYVRGTLVAGGDPAATASNIAGHGFLWRAGMAADLLMQVLDVPTIIIFYLLLRPVNHALALMSTAFNLVQTAVLALNKLALMTPLLVAGYVSHPGGLTAEQWNSLSYLAIQLHSYGFAIGLIFFGFTCLIRGYLLYRSSCFPAPLGILLALAGASYLINSFALILAPQLAQALFPAILIPAFVGELSLALWLLIKGVNLPKWQQQVAPAATP